MAEASLGSDEGDGDRRLERQAAAHDLAEHRADGVAREPAGPFLRQPIENGPLAFGIVKRREPGFALRFAHALDRRRATLEQAEHGLVERVDLRAEIVELAHRLDSILASAGAVLQPSIAVANLSIHVARSGSFKISW